MSDVLLINFTGPDRPGITTRLTGVLAGCGAQILDVAQSSRALSPEFGRQTSGRMSARQGVHRPARELQQGGLARATGADDAVQPRGELDRLAIQEAADNGEGDDAMADV